MGKSKNTLKAEEKNNKNKRGGINKGRWVTK